MSFKVYKIFLDHLWVILYGLAWLSNRFIRLQHIKCICVCLCTEKFGGTESA